MIRRQMGIDHGRLDVRVAEQLLNRGYVNAFHDQMTRKRVPQIVDPCEAGEPGASGGSDKSLAKVFFQSRAIFVAEHKMMAL